MFGPKKRGPKPETFLLKVSVYCIYFWVFRFIRLSFRGVASCAHRLNHFSDVCTPINFDATAVVSFYLKTIVSLKKDLQRSLFSRVSGHVMLDKELYMTLHVNINSIFILTALHSL